jgi:retinol-binding protein 3
MNHNARLPRHVLSRRDFIALTVAAAAVLTFPGCRGDETEPAGDTEAEDTVGPPLDAATRAAIIEDLLRLLKEKYVFLDVAGRIEEDVRERQGNGEYDDITDRAVFADTLTNNLQEVSHDEHLEVTPKSIDEAGPPGPPPATSEEDPSGFLYRAERLPGGVGYMDLRVFASPQSGAGNAAASAMNELNDTGTLIFDITQNMGGDPEMVALLCSYLLGPEPIHLNDIRWRSGDYIEVEEFWTQPEVTGERYGEDKPIYVLTSHNTFSAAEEFAYDLQALGRAIVVGETTQGGANPGKPFELAADFTVLIPIGEAVNPTTKTNWEGTGVKPDIAVSEEKAFETARSAALESLN